MFVDALSRCVAGPAQLALCPCQRALQTTFVRREERSGRCGACTRLGLTGTARPLCGAAVLERTTRVAWYGTNPGARSGALHVSPECCLSAVLDSEGRQSPAPVSRPRRGEPNRLARLSLYESGPNGLHPRHLSYPVL